MRERKVIAVWKERKKVKMMKEGRKTESDSK